VKGTPLGSEYTPLEDADQMILPGTLHTTLGSFPLQVLVDCGATGVFISDNLVEQLQLGKEPHPKPRPINVIDGRPIARPPTHQTIPYALSLGEHSEFLTFTITSLGDYQVVLGMPWLRRHDPRPFWSKNQLQFASEYCLSHCLSHPTTIQGLSLLHTLEIQVPSVSGPTSPPSDSGVRSLVPPEYHDFLDVFSKKSAETLPPHRPYDITIDLQPGAKLPVGPVYPMSAPKLQELKKQIDDLLRKGFIRPSNSPTSSPVLFVTKKDRTLRLCVDYKKLNSVTIKNKYPLPSIPTLLDNLQAATLYSKIDLRAAYNLVRVAEGHEYKTAFRCQFGQFEYLVMPFGLTNAPSVFQHFMNDVLHDLLDKGVNVYLDDIIIYSSDMPSHQHLVRQVLSRLRAHQLYAKAEKCLFHQTSIEFLGFVVSHSQISMDPAKVSSILDWPTPTTVKELQRFLGFANFYRKFISDYSAIVLPLTNLTRKNVLFTWTPREQHAFQTLKTKFTSAPTLSIFDPTKPITVETDASDYALGAILSQPDCQQVLHPVAYYSRKFTPAELNYPVHDKEMLAIIAATKEWHHYLEGSPHPITFLTDHKNLEYFLTSPLLNRRQARWSELLSTLDFTITYRSGQSNTHADALSRRPDYEADMPPLPPTTLLSPTHFSRPPPPTPHSALLPSPKPQLASLAPALPLFTNPPLEPTPVSSCPSPISQPSPNLPLPRFPFPPLLPTPNTPHLFPHRLSATYSVSDPTLLSAIHRAQSRDPHCAALLSHLIDSTPAPDVPHLDTYSTRDNLLFQNSRIYLPPDDALRLSLLHLYHDNPLAGHYGRRRTIQSFSRDFTFPGLRRFVTEYIRTCEPCQRNKIPRHAPHAPLRPLPIPTRPWSSISLDFITHLPPVDSLDAIFVVTCRLTKLAHFIPCSRTISAPQFADLFLSSVVRLHGFPLEIVSDRDPLFTSHFWKRLLTLCHIQPSMSTAFHPQTDGQTERLNQTLEQFLRIFVDFQQTTWPSLLPHAEFSYNNSVHASTGHTPFYLTYGFHPAAFPSILPDPRLPEAPAADSHLTTLQRLHATLPAILRDAQRTQARYFDSRRAPLPTFEPGELVWLLRRHIPSSRPSSKLDHVRLGPFPIESKVSSHAYRLHLPLTMRIHPTFHVTHLEPYHPNTFPHRPSPPPAHLPPSSDPPHPVTAILAIRKRGRTYEYLCDFLHLPPSERLWLPLSQLSSYPSLIMDFHYDHMHSDDVPIPPPVARRLGLS